ncbi:unnamed protein product [Caretta caretta]
MTFDRRGGSVHQEGALPTHQSLRLVRSSGNKKEGSSTVKVNLATTVLMVERPFGTAAQAKCGASHAEFVLSYITIVSCAIPDNKYDIRCHTAVI